MQIGLPGILLILFIVLKVFKVVAWSWFWVLSPIWIPLAIWGVIVLITLILAFIANM